MKIKESRLVGLWQILRTMMEQRNPMQHTYLEPETSTLKWLFQLDDSKSVHRGYFTKHPLKIGCLGYQVHVLFTVNAKVKQKTCRHRSLICLMHGVLHRFCGRRPLWPVWLMWNNDSTSLQIRSVLDTFRKDSTKKHPTCSMGWEKKNSRHFPLFMWPFFTFHVGNAHPVPFGASGIGDAQWTQGSAGDKENHVEIRNGFKTPIRWALTSYKRSQKNLFKWSYEWVSLVFFTPYKLGVAPPPRMPVTTRVSTCLVGDP